MDNSNSKWLILALALTIAYGVVISFYSEKLNEKLQLSQIENASLNDSVMWYYGKDSVLTSKFASLQFDANQRKDALEAAGFEIKELKDEGIKWRKVAMALKAEMESSGSGSAVIHDTLLITKTDTIKAGSFAWNNQYLFLSGRITEKKLDFNYTYRTKIQLFSEQQKGSYVISATLSDPNAKLITANSITVKPRKRWRGWDVIEIGGGFLLGALVVK